MSDTIHNDNDGDESDTDRVTYISGVSDGDLCFQVKDGSTTWLLLVMSGKDTLL